LKGENPHTMPKSQKVAIEKPRRWAFCRLTETEYWAYIRYAASLGLSRSRFTRKCLREGMGQGPDPAANDFETLHNAAMQLGSVGRNLNQLVRHLNSNKSVAEDELLSVSHRAIQATEKVGQAVRELVVHIRDRRIRSGD